MSGRVLHIQNEVTDPAVLFMEELTAAGCAIETVHAYAGEALPSSLQGFDGMVAGGGLVDTHQADEHVWLYQEMELIREAVRGGVPFMGLCLGAQLLAEATGGEVYRCEPHEIGWTPVELTPAAATDALFGGLPTPFEAMQWHFYACRVPPGGAELMRNGVCTQALRVGDAAWGTQFHIEVNRDSLMTWLDAAEDDLAANGYPREAFLRSLDEQLPAHMEIGRELARRLGSVIERRSSAAA